jgi:ketose-bisphosphate aldolase
MLATGTSVLQRGRAVAAFNTYTLESTVATVRAAERLGRPVLLSAGFSSYGVVGREPLAAAALAAAHAATVPVGVHLDHCRDPDEIDSCLALGYSSVMIDSSHLEFEANVELTRSVVERAHAAGAWVEAELGALSGDEDRSGGLPAAQDMTDPQQAAEFAARTGVDALAVAVGNVHGFTPAPVRLDIDRLRAIAAVCSAPLVLHGASGLPEQDLLGAVAAGVVKVNVNAELRRAHFEAIRAGLAETGDDVRALQQRAIEAMTRVAEEKIALLAGGSFR